MTLPDFWPTLHSNKLSVVRDQVAETNNKTVHFKSGKTATADFMVLCTGWGDHFAMFNEEHKADIGLPHSLPDKGAVDWLQVESCAEAEVDSKLPFLAKPPGLTFDRRLTSETQKKWRLYRRVVPVGWGEDRSLAILGQIHTVQTPLVSEVQSLWAILYLEGEIELPDSETMAREVALWNAWTRKRYLAQGNKFPYSLYDFLPVRPK